MPKQVLFKVMKLPTSKIIRNMVKEKIIIEGVEKNIPVIPYQFDMKKYSFNKALKNQEIVDIGDNLLFYKIREYYGNTKSPNEIYDQIQEINNNIKELKILPSSSENKKKIRELEQEKNDILYIKDIINIKVNNKDDYQKIALAKFSINGITYKRFCCGSGQMRRNTVTFINEVLYEDMMEKLMCGLRENGENKIDEIILAKLSAYFALSFSSVLWVTTPRICVIPDVYTTLTNQNIDYIKKDENGKKIVIPKTNETLELNSCDGEGIISPEFAEVFSKDMGLDYTACQFVVRTAFVKGCLLTFDFKTYLKEVCGVEVIKSIYDEEFKVDDVDVLITESMFKMHSFYKSVKEYEEYHKKYGLKWGVARYNKKVDDSYSLLNYQYIQNNNLNIENIDTLINPTVEWFNQICSGDQFYSTMYSIGSQGKDAKFQEIIENCGSTYTKAIVKNTKMLEDGYVKKKIYESIKESFKQAKIGRVWCRANYQFMISDPIPLLQNLANIEVKGIIPANYVYSAYWNKYIPEEIDLCRSPMVDRHEHNISKLYNDENTKKWYKYLYSGIIYSIYDLATIRHSDSD